MITSNKAELTVDLANRASCVKLLKLRDGHKFREYAEGDILDHVIANQPQFLGAVFAVIRAWHEAGCPRTDEHRHSFRDWAQILDWIVQNLLNEAPLLDGHRETKQWMTNPHLDWARDVAHAVVREGQEGESLLAMDLLELLFMDGSVEIPGAGSGGASVNRTTCLQQLGRKLSKVFEDDDVLEIDGFTIARESYKDKGSRLRTTYRFTLREPSKRIPTGHPAELVVQLNPSDAPTDLPLKTPQVKPLEPTDTTNDFSSCEEFLATLDREESSAELVTISGISGDEVFYSG